MSKETDEKIVKEIIVQTMHQITTVKQTVTMQHIQHHVHNWHIVYYNKKIIQ